MKRLYWPHLLVFSVSLGVYANSIDGAFVFDDNLEILRNPLINGFTSLSKVPELVTVPWRSVTQFTYAITFYFAGFRAPVFHATNIIIHALNSLLVFSIARRLSLQWLSPNHERSECKPARSVSATARNLKHRAQPVINAGSIGLAAGLIHAAHPIYTESVAYVWGRSSSLCALFYFSSFLLVILARQTEGSRRYGFYAAAILPGLLALATKEEAITLPFLIACYLLISGNWRAAAAVLAAPVVIVVSRWRQIEQLYRHVGANESLVSQGLEPALAPVPYALTYIKAAVTYYLPRFVLPVNLNADPQIHPVSSIAAPEFMAASGIAVGLVVWSLVSFRKQRYVLFSILAVLVSPMLAYAFMPLADIVAERRVYITGLGIDLLGAWILARMASRAGVALVVVVLAGLTIQRNTVWTSGITLWEDAERKSPNLARPHLNLGVEYQTAGNINGAQREYEHALSLNASLTPAYLGLGSIYVYKSSWDQAETMMLRAADLAPDSPEPYINLALIQISKKRGPEALSFADKAAAIDHTNYLAHFTRGDALAFLGRYGDAVSAYRESLRLNPRDQQLQEQVETRIQDLRKLGVIF